MTNHPRGVINRRFYQWAATLTVALTLFGTLPLTSAHAQKPSVSLEPLGQAHKTVRLLTVGNSFSGNATLYLGRLATAAGNTLVMHTVSIGGGTMAQHWGKAERYEHDSHDKEALYSSGRSLNQELHAEPWDFVTIQQASIESHNIATYRPYAARLADYIKKRAPQATLLVHETWEYRKDDSRFSAKKPAPGEPATQDAMYEQLRKSYDTIAGELGASIIPVGDAFHLADTDPAWGFKPPAPFNPKQFTYPALPEQTHSLHMGWYWKAPPKPTVKPTSDAPPTSASLATPSFTLTLQQDGHHANVAGQYLGACVFYEVLFQESVVGNNFVPKGLSAEDAQYLQKTAHEAVVARQKR